MRTWRYWKIVEEAVPWAGEALVLRVGAGSNESAHEAETEARRRLAWVRRRISGEPVSEPEPYEVDIREEVIEWLGDGAAVTRNRYGAHVLNAEALPILDVDDPPRRWLDVFRRATPELRHRRMVEALQDVAAWPACIGLGFRLYATAKGYRVILVGRPIHPSEALVARLEKAFHVDPLYARLCRRQGCYRARLTPKPRRMGHKVLRARFPGTEEDQAAIRAWEPGYLAEAAGWATCRFLLALGPDCASELVALHDARSGAFSDRPLA